MMCLQSNCQIFMLDWNNTPWVSGKVFVKGMFIEMLSAETTYRISFVGCHGVIDNLHKKIHDL